MRVLLIAIAGALGTVVRYGVGRFALRVTAEWPAGTIAVNVLGCFVLALVSELALRGARVSEDVRLVIGFGFCGGMTTYSTFNQDAMSLFRSTSPQAAVAYVMLTLVLCAGASAAGLVVARALTPVS